MTELLLNAILNIFALSAARLPAPARAGVGAALERYLRRHLRLAQPQVYLELFSEALDLHQEREPAELTAQAARVAATLHGKLPRLEQYVLLLRLLELRAALGAGADDAELVQAVAASLEIPPDEVARIQLLCRPPWTAIALDQRFLLLDPGDLPPDLACRRLHRPGFQGHVGVLLLAEVEALCLAVAPGPELTLDSIPLDPGLHLLPPGAVLRDGRGERVYQAEIAAALAGAGAKTPPIVFQGVGVDFRYPGSEVGLHDFSFQTHGGQMVGVMGGSGAGKSTLLGILNGRRRPDSGRVLVNGVDLHRQPGELEGVIGYVPQDDLLFDDLTVFDNLYFAACLCLANLDPEQRAKRVEAVLAELNQLEIRDLKVGSPLDKTISGGQRKRLNIALELIREPAILFVDEPTSGLSSADSENVMTLLKAQATQGRLVIVVIHQPSSRIYKMFDTLWLLDRGGRPIFTGNPLDALVYFRQAASAAGQEEYACPHCGQVNPEQLFEIIEERAVDDQGRYTDQRRVSPQEWHQRHLDRPGQSAAPGAGPEAIGPPERRLWRPGAWGQMEVFFRRNLKSRLANGMYMAINLIEPPLLAVLAALLCRGSWGGHYSFGANANLGIFFFISVVVALFLGLSVSAEEINRDRKILERERFLNLSWPAYVAAKSLYLALVSALQMAVYVAISHPILEIPDLGLTAWLVLFACAMVSCLVGLNISAALKSAVTIYILIPLLLVPQIMLGGAVVPYDELTWRNADQRYVPLVADLMPSRWGYESLVMAQFAGNRFYASLMADDCAVRQSDYLTDRYLYELRGLADYPFMANEGQESAAAAARGLDILRGELPRLARRTGQPTPAFLESLTPKAYSRPVQAEIKALLDHAEQAIRVRRQAAANRLDQAESARLEKLGRAGLNQLKSGYHNRELAKLALNQQTLEDLRLGRARVVQVTLPACQEPESPWGRAQFLAAHKHLGPWRLATPVFDLGVLAFMGLVAYAALYLALLPRLLAGVTALGQGLLRLRRT